MVNYYFIKNLMRDFDEYGECSTKRSLPKIVKEIVICRQTKIPGGTCYCDQCNQT